MVRSSAKLVTVGHIPREISRHVYFFLKEESGNLEGFIFSGKCRPSPILVGELEITLMLSFKSPRYFTHQKIKKLFAQLFSWDFEAKNADEAKFKTNNEDSEVVKPKKL